MGQVVFDDRGGQVELEAQAFASGGEAAVFGVIGYPRVVVKMYHSDVLRKRGTALKSKLGAMMALAAAPNFDQSLLHRLAWPRLLAFDESRAWRGYAMQRAPGVRMNVLAHAMAYKEHFPGLDRQRLITYLIDLLGTVAGLHRAGIYIGDYNLANFLCDPKGDAVMLIDCDSWQLTHAGKTFRCAVAAADMLPPELHGKELGKLDRNLPSELFALAILVFKVLMLGRHPYDVVGGEGPVANIQKGYFPYGIGGGGIPKGPWYNIWSHLPHKVKEQFIRTFRDGAADPHNRTSVAEWIHVLRLYQREMGFGWHEVAIRPAAPKSGLYRGSMQPDSPVSA